MTNDLFNKSFPILSPLQSGTEEVVRLSDAVAALAAATAERGDLLCALEMLIERMACDGVPNDSLPEWQEARGVLARARGEKL